MTPVGERNADRADERRADRLGGKAAQNPSRGLTWRDYAEFAKQSPERVYRDCAVDVFRATGPGGQGVNTTDSAVRMRHVPTGIVVVSRESRSQFQNRRSCLEKLRGIFARKAKPPRKRRKTKPTRGSKERRLKAKHVRGEIKSLRARRDFD